MPLWPVSTKEVSHRQLLPHPQPIAPVKFSYESSLTPDPVELKDKAASAIGVDVEKPADGTTQKASGEAIDAAKQKAGEVKADAKAGVREAADKTKQGAEQAKQKAS